MAAKGTSKAKATAASVAASDTSQENGASAPSSLETGVVGDLPTSGAASDNSANAGVGDESNTGFGDGAALAPGAGGDLAGGDSAAGNAGESLSAGASNDSANSGEGAVSALGAVSADSALPGDGDSQSLDSSESLTGAEGHGEAAQAAGQALSAGGVGDALLAMLNAAKTEQTPAENGPAEPVISTVWAMPEISHFPARITLENNTPSRFAALGNRLERYDSATGWVDEEGYARLSTFLAGHARLGKWDNLLGVQVKHDSND